VNGFSSKAATAIRVLLLADVAANIVLVESNGRDRITSRPEVFSGEVPQLVKDRAERVDIAGRAETPAFAVGLFRRL
jgi:hypothetical protein